MASCYYCSRTGRHLTPDGNHLCDTHHQRRIRGYSMTAPIRHYTSGVDRLEAAATRYADAESAQEYALARRALKKAAIGYCRHVMARIAGSV